MTKPTPSLHYSPRQSAERILADDGTWTKGDAVLCAEFVLAASRDLRKRIDEAKAALAGGDQAVQDYLRGGT